jgi:hypothetical protein
VVRKTSYGETNTNLGKHYFEHTEKKIMKVEKFSDDANSRFI